MPRHTTGSPTETQGTPSFDWERVDELPDPQSVADYLRRAAASGVNATDKVASLGRLEMQPGDLFLDFGCGVGGDLIAAADFVGSEGLCVGIDRSVVLLENADRSASNAAYVAGDGHRLPFADGTFHRIHCERTLQHVSRPVDAIAEMARVLRPGGRVVISEPDYRLDFWDHPLPDLTARILDAQWRRIRNATMGRHLTRLVTLAGLVDVHTEVVPYYWLETEAGTFASTISSAVRDGAVTEEEAAVWTSRLEAAAAISPVLAGCIRFRVTATAPPAAQD